MTYCGLILNLNISSFAGVDMSESAIDIAHSALKQTLGPSVPIAFHVCDMLSYLRNVRGEYDVIMAAFALHHLTSEDKIKVSSLA